MSDRQPYEIFATAGAERDIRILLRRSEKTWGKPRMVKTARQLDKAFRQEIALFPKAASALDWMPNVYRRKVSDHAWAYYEINEQDRFVLIIAVLDPRRLVRRIVAGRPRKRTQRR